MIGMFNGQCPQKVGGLQLIPSEIIWERIAKATLMAVAELDIKNI